MKLSELKNGETAVIVRVSGHGGFRKRIMEMGFVRGQDVTSVINAPMNDPIKYSIMGYDVSLRRSEAELITVLSPEEADAMLSAEDAKAPNYYACGEFAPAIMDVSQIFIKLPNEISSTLRLWEIPTAEKHRCSTLFRVVTNMWATIAA